MIRNLIGRRLSAEPFDQWFRLLPVQLSVPVMTICYDQERFVSRIHVNTCQWQASRISQQCQEKIILISHHLMSWLYCATTVTSSNLTWTFIKRYFWSLNRSSNTYTVQFWYLKMLNLQYHGLRSNKVQINIRTTIRHWQQTNVFSLIWVTTTPYKK